MIRVVGPQLIGAVSAAGLGFALRQALISLPSVERLFILSAAYVVVYLAVVVGLFRETTPVDVCLSVAHDFMPAALKPAKRITLARASESTPRCNARFDTEPPAGVNRNDASPSAIAAMATAVLSVIGFVLIPLVRWSRYDDGSVGRLIVSLGALLVALRVVPAIARRPFHFGRHAGEWFTRRRIAKKYDSYQWRKLLWIGIGLRRTAGILDRHTGGAGARPCVRRLRWSRSSCVETRHLARPAGLRASLNHTQHIPLEPFITDRGNGSGRPARVCLLTARRFSRMAFQCGFLEAQDVLHDCGEVELDLPRSRRELSAETAMAPPPDVRDISRKLAFVNPGLKRVELTRAA